jgi:hypothetical protein
MSEADSLQTERLVQRVAALERRLSAGPVIAVRPTEERRAVHPVWPLALGLAAVACGYLAMGLPQHYYQPLFAALVLMIGYHRRVWHAPAGGWRWTLAVLNFVVLAFGFKLLIGAGTSYPFEWMRLPSVTTVPPTEAESWFSQALPHLTITWEGVPGLSDWHYDHTQVQTLLLITTVFAALFRFQPFASFTALVLVLVSIPTLVDFNWDWLIPFLVLAGAALYLQTGPIRLSVASG